MNTEIKISAIWARRIGNKVQVLTEIDNEWRLVLEEDLESNFSYIAECNGAKNWPVDSVTNPK